MPIFPKNQDDIPVSLVLGFVLHELGGRVTLTPGSVSEFEELKENMAHFLDVRSDKSGNLVVTSLLRKDNGQVDETYIGIDYDREYPRGCISKYK